MSLAPVTFHGDANLHYSDDLSCPLQPEVPVESISSYCLIWLPSEQFPGVDDGR